MGIDYEYEQKKHSSAYCEDCQHYEPAFRVDGNANWEQYVGKIGYCQSTVEQTTRTVPLSIKADCKICRKFKYRFKRNGLELPKKPR